MSESCTEHCPRRPAAARRALGLVGAALLLMLVAAPAQGARRHFKLLRSLPASGAVLTTSPDAIRLWFSEPIELPMTRITLTAAGGTPVALGVVTAAPKKEGGVAALISAPLPIGVYTVKWKGASKDGHVVQGTFTFRVRASK